MHKNEKASANSHPFRCEFAEGFVLLAVQAVEDAGPCSAVLAETLPVILSKRSASKDLKDVSTPLRSAQHDKSLTCSQICGPMRASAPTREGLTQYA